MVPKRTLVEKHSRITARSVGDFRYEYHKHASPLPHVFCWLTSFESKDWQSGASVEKSEPQEKQRTPSARGCGLRLGGLRVVEMDAGLTVLGLRVVVVVGREQG